MEGAPHRPRRIGRAASAARYRRRGYLQPMDQLRVALIGYGLAGRVFHAPLLSATPARALGRQVIPFHNRRWDGDFLTVRKLIGDGALGTVFRFESRFERWRGTPKSRWLATDAEARANGEGLLLDIGPHLVDQALVLF